MLAKGVTGTSPLSPFGHLEVVLHIVGCLQIEVIRQKSRYKSAQSNKKVEIAPIYRVVIWRNRMFFVILRLTRHHSSHNYVITMKKRILLLAVLASMLTVAYAQSERNTTLETIMTRTSVRKYADRPVEKEKIEAMLRAGMAAPTAVNKQPWHFVVVNDKAKLNELAASNPRAGMLKSAPLAVVVCGDMDKALQGKGQAYWIQDCSAATENILLAAHSMGLGAVWTGVYPMEDRIKPLSKMLKLPETVIPLCTIVIGYPAEQPTPKDKWKPENISYNEYGQK